MATSPKFNGGDSEHLFDPNFSEEISHKMQVPKRIKVNGDNEDDVVMGVGGSQPVSAWLNEKIDMHVPDRILVIGQNEFSGTRGTPLEASHENAVLRPEVERVRVQTPPSTITMHEYNFPSAVEDPPDLGSAPPPPYLARPKGRRPPFEGPEGANFTPLEGGDRLRSEYNPYRGGMDSRNDSFNDRYRMQNISQYREGRESPVGDGMSANEEIAHLRRQLAKLNRRVMSIELENLQRQQYEKIACALSVGYIVWKTLLWLRSSS
ncbi:transport and Golgi organization protein 11 isoform X2 [Nilaparvata lugens]|uniref:transport and Golgi organization protein 11 isoform X2 n=1 Tax=Nilaparvata lugens TaxID=108931 RepID=UPI00193CA395|nr:transport and Golgi organization protein 11 isoform X2 [Nilaparvata lugens]